MSGGAREETVRLVLGRRLRASWQVVWTRSGESRSRDEAIVGHGVRVETEARFRRNSTREYGLWPKHRRRAAASASVVTSWGFSGPERVSALFFCPSHTLTSSFLACRMLPRGAGTQAFLPVERALYAAGMRDGDVVTLVDGLPANQETLAALGEKAHSKCVSA